MAVLRFVLKVIYARGLVLSIKSLHQDNVLSRPSTLFGLNRGTHVTPIDFSKGQDN